MVESVIEGVRIAGARAVVPRGRHCFSETPNPFTAEEAAKLYALTGVYERRVAPLHIQASDLCVAAAEGLLAQLGWDPATVDALIFISQDADYNVPATACVMHKRLGLKTGAACFDVNLGCSGFVYGVWTTSQLLRGSNGRRALVLCGDMSSRHLVPDDRAARPLFGDAGSAIALERADDAAPMRAVLGTDGSGARNIIVRAGGRRRDLTPGLVSRTPEEEARLFEESRLSMDGSEIFAFTLRVVPTLVRDVLALSGLSIDDIDHCVLHQANGFMLEHLRKKIKIPADRFINDMRDFGNTSSASIPLAISHRLGPSLASGPRKLLLAGFGVGWSWGALVAEVGPIPEPTLAELPDDFPVLEP